VAAAARTVTMWRHIPNVANGLTLQGGLELLLALVILVGGKDSDARAAESLYETALLAVGPPLLFMGGGLKALAASRNRRFVGRRLGLAALWSALPTALVWSCAPTGFALLAYGTVVYRNARSREAFALGESGKTPAEVRAALDTGEREGPSPAHER